jgi:hypothetical protein
VSKHYAVGLACLLIVGGCASQEEITARRAAKEASINAQDDSKCRSYGVEPGSQGYFQCRMILNQQRVDKAALDKAMDEQRSLALMEAGFSMMANSGR